MQNAVYGCTMIYAVRHIFRLNRQTGKPANLFLRFSVDKLNDYV